MDTYTLQRQSFDPNCTPGKLYDPNGALVCFTMELPWLDNAPDVSCIPAGQYIFEQYLSPKHGLVWMLQNVPGRSFIEIHGGNTEKDLLGCICVGDAFSIIDNLPAVINSQNTLKMLRSSLPIEGNIIISNPKEPIP